MKLKRNKLLSLFLVFCLIAISCTTIATQRQKGPGSSKERKHGAELIITKKNGYQIAGELITVKPNSLLLLDTEGKDVSIDIADIKVIRIIKKSKAGEGYIIGGAVGYGVATLIVLSPSSGEDYSVFWTWILLGALLAMPASLLGGTIGAIAGTDKTIQIEGMTDSELHAVMDKLRKKARIRDYK